MKIRTLEVVGLAREQHVRGGQRIRVHFPGTVVSRAQLLDAHRVHVEPHHVFLLTECHRHGQSDIAEPDNGNLATVRHHSIP